jgi:hypothetical protein
MESVTKSFDNHIDTTFVTVEISKTDDQSSSVLLGDQGTSRVLGQAKVRICREAGARSPYLVEDQKLLNGR